MANPNPLPIVPVTLTEDQRKNLAYIAKRLTEKGKGIAAGDEGVFIRQYLLKQANIEPSEENRQKWFDLLMSVDDRIAQHISGVLCLDETVRRIDKNGNSVPEGNKKKGMLTGVKVDKGLEPLAGTHDEYTTAGLDNLKDRCEEYKRMGCDFASCRCVFKISDHTPSSTVQLTNNIVLARFAGVIQQAGLVPIIEPCILSEGLHDLQKAQTVTQDVISQLYRILLDLRVYLEGSLLRINMVTPGTGFNGVQFSTNPTPEEMAKATVETLTRSVPVAVGGIVFLSKSNGEESSTILLNAINKVPESRRPWPLTFAFGRALTTSVLVTWGGKDENVKKAQEMLIKMAELNGQASQGLYKGRDGLPPLTPEEVSIINRIQQDTGISGGQTA